MHLSHAYGLWHLSWLIGIAGVSFTLAVCCRRNLVPQGFVRIALACLIVGGELQRFFTDDIHWPDTLPLNLCNITSWVAVIALITLWRGPCEFVYFAGYCGAGMALITPDLGGIWPARFFVNHGAIIITASVLVFGRLSPLQPGAIWRAYGWFSVYIGLTFVFDMLTTANYSYLREKPKATTLLSILGPWPWYILGAGAVALILFWLLWLPARPRNVKGRDAKPEMAVGSTSFAERP